MSWNNPWTWLAGKKYTPVDLNAQIRDNFKALTEWEAWAPAVSASGFTLGNGTIIAGRIDAGKWCAFQIILTIGSTTVVGTSNIYVFNLPAACTASNMYVGGATILDTSVASIRNRHVYANTTTTCAAQGEDGTYVGGSAPFALANGDTIKVNGIIQKA